MQPSTVRSQDAHPPTTDLVTEPLDHNRPIIRDRTRGVCLIPQESNDVAGRKLIKIMSLAQARYGVGLLAYLADELPQSPAEFARPTRPAALPERHLGFCTRSRGHHDTLEGDVLDPPRGRSQQEDLPGTTLVDHLLVEFPDPRTVGQEHTEGTPVRDRARVGNSQALRALPAPQRRSGTIVHDSGSEPRELLGRVDPGQQIHDVRKDLGRQLIEVGTASHHRQQVVEIPVVHGAHGHNLLRQHIEGVARNTRVLDQPTLHAIHDHRGLEQLGAMLGKDLAAARFAHLMAGPPDPLETRSDRTGRTNLDHQVDRPHVDAEFKGRCSDEPPQIASLELLLNL